MGGRLLRAQTMSLTNSHTTFLRQLRATDLLLAARPALTGALAASALGLAGCGLSEAEARQALEEKGLTIVEIHKEKEGFSFVATREKNRCTGTITGERSPGSQSTSINTFCDRDTTACKKGAPAECVKIADELYAEEAKVFPRTAAELYRTACEDNDAHACARASEFEAISKTWDKVREFAKKGCDLGDGAACARLGSTEALGNGTPKDVAKARELFARACDKGDLRGCRNAAAMNMDEEPKDLRAAMPFAKKACEGSRGVKGPTIPEDACFVWGVAQFQAKEYPAALTQLSEVCKIADHPKRGLACNIAGVIVTEGYGVPKDVVLGVSHFLDACEAKNGEACMNLSKVYTKGPPGIKKNPEKAKAFAEQACSLGEKAACKP